MNPKQKKEKGIKFANEMAENAYFEHYEKLLTEVFMLRALFGCRFAYNILNKLTKSEKKLAQAEKEKYKMLERFGVSAIDL